MAMEDFSGEDDEIGEILVYLNAQYYNPGYSRLAEEITRLKEELALLKAELH
jgi:hypothetical protein